MSTDHEPPPSHLLRIGSKEYSVFDLMLDVAAPEWIAALKYGQGTDAERVAENLRVAREATAPDSVRAAATGVLRSGLTLMKRERVPLNHSGAARQLLKYATGSLDRDTTDLVISAANVLMARELLASLPADDQDASRVLPTWRTVDLALRLGQWMGAADVHNEVHVRRSATKATKARQRKRDERISDLVRAMQTAGVEQTPAGIVKWRGEEMTHANRERARKDLARARSAIAAKRRS